MNGFGGTTTVWAPMDVQDSRRYSIICPPPRRPLDRFEGRVRIRQHPFLNSGVRCTGQKCDMCTLADALWVWVRDGQPERVGTSAQFTLLCEDCGEYYERTGHAISGPKKKEDR